VNKKLWSIAVLISFLAVVLFFTFRNQEGKYLNEPYEQEKVLLGTLVSIKAYGPDNKKVEEGVNEALEEIERIDQEMDSHNPKSEVSKINRLMSQKAPSRTKISKYLSSVIVTSRKYSTESHGAFDITIGPVMELWGFNKEPEVPSNNELQEALAFVNMNNLEIDEKNNILSFKKSGMQIELGGVAKGYAVDRAVAILKKKGIKKALVTTGSATTVIGSKPGRSPWQIGIRDPRKEERTIGTLKLTDTNVSTSGDYQIHFEKNGKRYHHILNPQTGLPAEGFQSVTIVTTKSCTEADIISTAVFVLGYPEGLDFVKRIGQTEAVVIDSKGKIHITPGLEDIYKKENDN